MASFGVIDTLPSGLQVKEIFSYRYSSGNKGTIQNANYCEITDGNTTEEMCSKSICIDSISGSYATSVKVKKTGYYQYVAFYEGTTTPSVQLQPVLVNAGSNLYSRSANTTGFIAIYLGETNPLDE